jgi:hypothetical protein
MGGFAMKLPISTVFWAIALTSVVVSYVLLLAYFLGFAPFLPAMPISTTAAMIACIAAIIYGAAGFAEIDRRYR